MNELNNYEQNLEMKDKYFEIFHYTENQKLAVLPHIHNYYEIYLSLSDNIDYIVDGVLYSLENRDLLFISPFQIHYPVIKDNHIDYNRIVIRLSKEYMNLLAKIDENIDYSFKICEERKNCLVRLYNTTIQSLLTAVIMLLDEANSNKMGKSLSCYSSMANLLVHFNRSVYFQGSFEMSTHAESIIDDVVKYIYNNATKNLNLEEIASEFHLSRYYLSHLFKKKMGISIYDYVIQRRMILAKNNILSNIPISEVAELCGFKDYAGFYRAFKKEYGLSPRDFKKLHSKQN